MISLCRYADYVFFSGIVNEKLLSDYLHHVFPASTKQGPASAGYRLVDLVQS